LATLSIRSSSPDPEVKHHSPFILRHMGEDNDDCVSIVEQSAVLE
jgi:hypothetical protein